MELFRVEVPLKKPWITGTSQFKSRESTLVHVETDVGDGWGECAALPEPGYTTEFAAFQRLKRQLAAYRVVFGQPRQEELMTLLEQSSFDLGALRRWAVDLAPPESEPRS